MTEPAGNGIVGSGIATWRLETPGGGAIGVLTIDAPGQKVNVLSGDVLAELGAQLERIPHLGLSGLVITSGKPRTFIAGADVREIQAIHDPEEGALAAARGQAIFQRLASLAIPTLAAIDGLCLGGGTELALACRYRVASDFERTFLGLPEVRLGILPGFGGSTRLPRLIGVPAALDLILTGKTVDGSRAFKLGLVDDVLPREDFPARAVRWLATRLDAAAFERVRAERRRRRAGPPRVGARGQPDRPRARVLAGEEVGAARNPRPLPGAAQGARDPAAHLPGPDPRGARARGARGR